MTGVAGATAAVEGDHGSGNTHEVTDVHAHLLMPGLHAEVERRVPDEVQAAAELELKRNGLPSLQASGRMIGERFPRLTSVEARLAAMDAQGVDRQWVSPSPNHFYPWANEGLATWARTGSSRSRSRSASRETAGRAASGA